MARVTTGGSAAAPRAPLRQTRWARGRSAAFTAGLAAAASCSSFTDLDTFDAQVEACCLPDEVVVHAAEGEITVSGRFRSGTPCVDTYARYRREGRGLVVRVLAWYRGAGPCVDVVAYWSYDLTIPGLSSGEYRLVVLHSWPVETVVFDAPVAVPD